MSVVTVSCDAALLERVVVVEEEEEQMPEGARLQEMHLEDAVDRERGDVLAGHAAHVHQMLKTQEKIMASTTKQHFRQ